MGIAPRLRAVLLLCVVATSAFGASGSLRGRVVSRGEGKGEPLVGATVMLQGSVRGTTTNTKGEFSLMEVPAGTYAVVVSLIGYQRETRSNVMVEEGKEAFVAVSMESAPVVIDQVVVTASKRQQSLEEVPVSISVLEATQIRERNSLTIDDALRYIPGVNMTGFQVNIRGSSGYSRGAGSRVLMLLDGIPFITGDTGELSFETIPVSQVERIEVVKGASSALYGSNALGGVINIITKDIPDQPETDVRLYGGQYDKPSFNQWKWSDHPRYYDGLSVSHMFRSGNLGISLFLSHQSDDGYRQNDYHRRTNLYLKAKEDFSQSSSLTLNFGLLDQFGGQYLYWRNIDSAYLPPVAQAGDDVKSSRYYISGLYNSVISEKLLITTKAMWFHNFWGFETRSHIGMNKSESDDFRLDVAGTMMVDSVHTVMAGVQGSGDAIGGDLFADHVLAGFGLFVQDEIRLFQDFTVTAGLRFDFQSAGLTTQAGQLNPKLALSYIPFEGTTLRASVGRGFRVPSVAEAFIGATVNNLATIPNKDLRPERSVSYEVGISQRIWNFGLIDVAAFRNDYDNLIEPGLIVDGGNVIVQWRNVLKARVQGFETGLKFGFFDGALTSNFGYTFVYPEDVTNHDLLRYRPRHILYANLMVKIWHFFGGADFRFLSRVDRIDEELEQVGIVADADARVDNYVADFRAGYDFSTMGLPLSLTAMVNNALNYNYIELIGNMMPPRTYSLVLEIRP